MEILIFYHEMWKMNLGLRNWNPEITNLKIKEHGNI